MLSFLKNLIFGGPERWQDMLNQATQLEVVAQADLKIAQQKISELESDLLTENREAVREPLIRMLRTHRDIERMAYERLNLAYDGQAIVYRNSGGRLGRPVPRQLPAR